jgi:hypothetical protein
MPSGWEYSTAAVINGEPLHVTHDGDKHTVLQGLVTLDQFLKQMGDTGWEAIEIPGTGDNYKILFKRPATKARATTA